MLDSSGADNWNTEVVLMYLVTSYHCLYTWPETPEGLSSFLAPGHKGLWFDVLWSDPDSAASLRAETGAVGGLCWTPDWQAELQRSEDAMWEGVNQLESHTSPGSEFSPASVQTTGSLLPGRRCWRTWLCTQRVHQWEWTALWKHRSIYLVQPGAKNCREKLEWDVWEIWTLEMIQTSYFYFYFIIRHFYFLHHLCPAWWLATGLNSHVQFGSSRKLVKYPDSLSTTTEQILCALWLSFIFSFSPLCFPQWAVHWVSGHWKILSFQLILKSWVKLNLHISVQLYRNCSFEKAATVFLHWLIGDPRTENPVS